MKKSGCQWLLVSHDPVDPDSAWQRLAEELDAESEGRRDQGAVVIKFEPFILHVQCRNLEVAKWLHTQR